MFYDWRKLIKSFFSLLVVRYLRGHWLLHWNCFLTSCLQSGDPHLKWLSVTSIVSCSSFLLNPALHYSHAIYSTAWNPSLRGHWLLLGMGRDWAQRTNIFLPMDHKYRCCAICDDHNRFTWKSKYPSNRPFYNCSAICWISYSELQFDGRQNQLIDRLIEVRL